LKQLEFCYAINRRSSIPFHIYVTSFCEKIEEIAKATFPVHKSWKLNFETQSHLEVFDKSKIVYLTAESPNKLTILEEDKIYIIGGLVDHNHHKGLCHRIAIENGLETAHLPINENVQLASRNILTVNQGIFLSFFLSFFYFFLLFLTIQSFYILQFLKYYPFFKKLMIGNSLSSKQFLQEK